MTAAILDFPAAIPNARDLMERALEPHILIGMPHLEAHGLSETWLMKELGHRHWLMLARFMGMNDADFRTASGSQAYAAICATSLRDAHFDQVSANDVLAIRSALSPVSRTQMSSTHRLFAGMLQIAEVELISTFVHHAIKGDNHSIARVQLPGASSVEYSSNTLAETAAGLRASRDGPICGRKRQIDAGSVAFRTSASQEFNGAGLFYFAEFQALMERAYEQLFQTEAVRSKISCREVFFFGNLRGNEILNIELSVDRTDSNAIDCLIRRADEKIIAYARSVRAPL